jgi:hypothetical protein
MKQSNEEVLTQTILSNLREIIAKDPGSYSAYVADLTIRTILKAEYYAKYTQETTEAAPPGVQTPD